MINTYLEMPFKDLLNIQKLTVVHLNVTDVKSHSNRCRINNYLKSNIPLNFALIYHYNSRQDLIT